MRKIFLFVILFFQITLAAQSDYNSADYKNFEKANTVFSKLDSLNYNKIDSISYALEGTWIYQGHYALPRQNRKIPLNIDFEISQNNYNKAIFKYVLDAKKTYTQVELFSSDTSYIVAYGKEVADTGDYLRKTSNIPFHSPMSVYWDIKQNRETLRYIGEDDKNITLSYNSSFLKQVSITIDKNKYHISSIQFLKYDSLEGDYILQYNYLDYPLQGLRLPQKLLISKWEVPLMELNYKNTYTAPVKEDTTFAGYSIKEISPNLHLITLPTGQHQSFVTDYGDYLGIIELPINEAYTKQIVDFVKQHFSNKPIKYAFLTHHHPDHAGGFAYCYKNGMTVVTTPITQKYLLQLLNRKHLLREQEITYTTDGDFIIIPSLAEKKFSNQNLEMIAYEMGKNSHTDEFILYYFPQSKILIVGDLYYSSSKTYPSERASNIFDFIKKKKLKVEKCYQTWGWQAKEFSTVYELKQAAELFREKTDD